jgi:phosphate/sulfate permease
MPMFTFEVLLLLGLSTFFALNMGGSTMAPAFGVAIGARILTRRQAVALFCVFLVAGALLIGGDVAKVLTRDIVPAATLDRRTILVAVGAASTALFVANLLRIPQSTVWCTVFALTAIGLARGNLKSETLLYRFVPAWVGLPLASFALTAGLTRIFYPLRGWNYRLYEHLQKHEWKMRGLVVASSCYVAFSAGGNNVPNVVGPLAAANVFDVFTCFVVMAPIYGLGGALFRAPTRTVGNDVVPVGPFSATICNLVTGSMILLASRLEVSQSLVQVNMAAVLAVSLVKDGGHLLVRHRTLWRTVALWFVTPLIALGLTFALVRVGE